MADGQLRRGNAGACVKTANGHEAATFHSDARLRLIKMTEDSLHAVGRRKPVLSQHEIIVRLATAEAADKAAIVPSTTRVGGTELKYEGQILDCFNAMRSWATLAE